MLHASSRWILPLVLWFGPGCDDQDTGQLVAHAAAHQLRVVPPVVVPLRERREKALLEDLLESEALLAELDAQFARRARLDRPGGWLRLEVRSNGMWLNHKWVEQTRLAQFLRERIASEKPEELGLHVHFVWPAVSQARVEDTLDVAMAAGIAMYSVSIDERCPGTRIVSSSGRK